MARTRIKFCGITRVVDAIAAVAAGADAVGLVFCKTAARRISLETAREIITHLPPFVTPVGLFVDSTAAEILEIAGQLGLRTVQLHGHESPDMLKDLHGLSIIKAVHADPANDWAVLAPWRQAFGDLPPGRFTGLLLETPSAQPGGTGIENNWSLIQSAHRAGVFADLPPLILAGGLTPANVADVVRSLRPHAVDVSSGIEETKGMKSNPKMTAFSAAVAAADQRLTSEQP